MNRPGIGIFVMLAAIPSAPGSPALPALTQTGISMYATPDPMGGAGAGGGGQVEYDAERANPFSRLMFGATASSLGIGVEAGTNLGPRVDLRLFGDYTNLTHNFTQSGFHIALNVNLANTGAKVDFYPLRRFPLRISPGYLYFNGNRLAAQLHAETNATFTINNVDYASDNANPVYGTGRLLLGGSGFMATAGLGHFVSHTYKRLTFPFEAGVVFIDTPLAQFNLYGKVCSVDNPGYCQPAAQFPTFATNLAAQVKSWNRTVSPYHIYPVIEGGVSYSFSFRQRRRNW
jgi:hypothetical protein